MSGANAAPPSSMPTASRRRTRSAGREDRRGTQDPVPEALHGVQHRAMRGLPEDIAVQPCPSAIRPGRAEGRGAHQGRPDIDFPHRRRPGVLRPGLDHVVVPPPQPISSRSTGTGRPCMSWVMRQAKRAAEPRFSGSLRHQKYALGAGGGNLGRLLCLPSALLPTVRQCGLHRLLAQRRAARGQPPSSTAASQASKTASTGFCPSAGRGRLGAADDEREAA